MGPGLGHNIQFPGHRPRSSCSCQAQISHSAAHRVSQSGALSSTQLLSLWVCTTQITIRVSQPAGEADGEVSGESLQSSCPPFLTSPQLFTQPYFPTSPKTIWVRVPCGPTPPFSRYCPACPFLGGWHPQVQIMCTSCVCLPLYLYSSQRLPLPSSLLVPGCPSCSGRGGSWCSNSPLCSLWQVLG